MITGSDRRSERERGARRIDANVISNVWFEFYFYNQPEKKNKTESTLSRARPHDNKILNFFSSNTNVEAA